MKNAANTALPDDEIRRAVARLLASEELTGSKRLQRFLAYVVEESLAGRGDAIKEYSVAVAVYDRDNTFDSRIDNIVRVEARRLRQQLATYYNGAGSLDPVVIDLPKGTYAPVFRRRDGVKGAKGGDQEGAEGGHRNRPVWVRRAAGLGAAATLVAVGVALWQFGVFQASRVPAKWVLAGSELKVLDAQDRLCWRKQFPTFHRAFEMEVRDKVLIADIDGDGRQEVLFNFFPEDPRQGTGSLICFEQNGRRRWEYRYGEPKSFGSRTFEVRYRGMLIRPVLVSGKRFLVAVANHNVWYPAQVSLLDVATGRRLEEYWHPGSIYRCALQDIDGDGVDEFLFGAINNPGDGLGHAALGVLKLPFSKAPRPAPVADDPFPALTGGGELAYLLFPLADVSRALGQLPMIAELGVDELHRIMVETGLPEAGGIVYYLDSHFHVVDYRTSDNLAPLHERLFRQHLLDHQWSSAESAALGKVIRFAAAPDGNLPGLQRFWSF